MAETSLKGSVSSTIAILDLPVGSRLSIDGVPTVLQRDDFVGICHVPHEEASWHLLTVRAAGSSNQSSVTGVTTAFIVGGEINENCSENSEAGLVLLARRYDPLTEEVSDARLDARTISNLAHQLQYGTIQPQRLDDYDRFCPPEMQKRWRNLTNFITIHVLRKRGLRPGDKVVPGTYHDDDNFHDDTNTMSRVDGHCVSYPPIPVLENSRGFRHTRHTGAKLFLRRLSSAQRTALFMAHHPADQILTLVLQEYYENDPRLVLGDMQLAFVLLIHLQCYASLEHWRDLIALLSRVSAKVMQQHVEMYQALVQALVVQLSTFGTDLYENADLVDQDNFLGSSLEQLFRNMQRVPALVESSQTLHAVVKDRQPALLPYMDGDFADGDVVTCSDNIPVRRAERIGEDESDEDKDPSEHDGPTVVDMNEINGFQQREAQALPQRGVQQAYSVELRQAYPLLFAAQLSREDIVMTCARALDTKNDVSLVREAADYLENVEAKQQAVLPAPSSNASES